jgi:AAA15 family ATPase/GTPase
MIQEVKVRNFMSFKDEVTFSFEATRDKTFEEYQVVEVAKGVRLLRFALVYGANASGKSNLLRVFDFLSRFWFTSTKDQDASTRVIPFRLDQNTPGEPSRFEVKFYVGETKYWYVLELDSHKVYEEKLFFYKSSQPTQLFSRELKDGQSVISFNSAVVKISKAAQEEISLKCLANMSLFAARNQVNVLMPEIDAAKDWMRLHIMPGINPQTYMFDYAGERMLKDQDMKSYLLDFVHKADFNITGVRTDIVSESVETTFEHTVQNERGTEKYTLPNNLQSDGTTRTFGIEAAIYQALKTQSMIHIDEIEASLHPELVEFILQKFLAEKGNRSQLLITTHYDPLLNTVNDLLRSDSVWFTEKDESGSTKLYSLVEFKGLKRISSLQKAYRNGQFGALPSIKG